MKCSDSWRERSISASSAAHRLFTYKSAVHLSNGILEGAARRIRPKLMTVVAMTAGLLPLLWSSGTGADLMKRVAAPMVGGLMSSFALELLVYPALFAIWMGRGLPPSGPAARGTGGDSV
jgi:Cu(I)/Ag(I) efflux system membrane protein CusA/SilA